jgi:two-component system chemotaxis sensor kinase CheA
MDLSRFYQQFREETTENIRIFTDGMLVLEKTPDVQDPTAREQVDAIFRAMHTIKGSSRLLGFGAIGRLAHTMENILGAVREGSQKLDRSLIDDMLKSGDALLEMTMAAVEGGSTNINVDELIEKLNRSLEGKTEAPAPASPQPAEQPAASAEDSTPSAQEKESATSGEASAEERRKARAERRKARAEQAKREAEGSQQEGKEPAEPPQEEPPSEEEDLPTDAAEAPVAPPEATPAPSAQPTPARVAAAPKRQTVRVRVDRLDTLINLTGELVVGKQIQSDHVDSLYKLNELIQQQEHDLLAIEDTLRDIHLSADQRHMLDQQLNILLNTGDQARKLLRQQIEQFGQHVENQGMLIDDLEQEVMAVRMLPIATVFSTLPRAVRELAGATNKEVNLELRGEATELDRKLLEALGDPLMHLIRNGIDHGIETPEEREEHGKPRQGLIEVSAEAVGGEVHIIVKDDGRGMEAQKLRDTAVRKGLISRENATLLSDQEALELIFLPGFSSASLITDISGRGVGMDVVRTNIVELGGQVNIESQPGHGTTITLNLPLTIVTTRILLIKVGQHAFALPASGCHGIIWAYESHIRTIEGRATITHEGQTVPLLRMADLMNIEAEPSFLTNKREPAVLIGTAQRLLSLLVDSLLDEREAVVKPLGPIFETQRRYNGAVQLGDGQLVLLLNPVSLVQSARGIAQTPRTTGSASSTQKRPHLLIAEDSFTTRELIRSILQSAGYDVTAAIDGLAALDKLRVQSYDLVVTDVEMPRVDGFELTSRIRHELEDQDMPVVIITSLASDEYRRRGLEAGAQAYIVKSQFNQDNLLKVISQLLGHDVGGSL